MQHIWAEYDRVCVLTDELRDAYFTRAERNEPTHLFWERLAQVEVTRRAVPEDALVYMRNKSVICVATSKGVLVYVPGGDEFCNPSAPAVALLVRVARVISMEEKQREQQEVEVTLTIPLAKLFTQ